MPTARTSARPRLRLGKLSIDRVTFEQALDDIEALIDAGQGGAVFTPNLDHVVQADRNPAFEQAYARADLSLVDGKPLLWAARALGEPLPEKISGSDLIEPLCRRVGKKARRVYYLGGAPGVAEKAAATLAARHGVVTAGCHAPIVRPDGTFDDPELLPRLLAAKPDLVFVALGSPKQELLIDRLAAQVRPAVALGIGASLDFVAGTVRRAPPWVSELGLEWAYRLSQEPRRLWRRYLVDDPRFVGIFLRTWREGRRPRGSA